MNGIIDWIKSNNWEYKTRPNKQEIDLKICPICNAVSCKTGKVTNDNYWSFSVNYEKGTYKCLRGSCNAKGHINILSKLKLVTGKYKQPDVNFKENEFQEELKKEFDKIVSVDRQDTLTFLNNRLISKETAIKLNCRADKATGDLIFPCYENGILVNYKRRFLVPIKLKNRELKTKNSSKGKSVFYGMQNCIEYNKPVILVEGEMDLLSIVESGYDNVVSIPNGASSIGFINQCWEFLDSFTELIIWFDNDKAGNDCKKALIPKLSKWKLKEIISQEKDANDVLINQGKEKVIEYINSSTVIDVEGIIDISKIERRKLRDLRAVSTGIYGIDVHTKGKRGNEVTIISGKNNNGKSTYVGQEILSLIQNKEHVFLYSGELSKEMVKEWLYTQACTQDKLIEYKHPITKLKEYEVKDDDFEKIDLWMRGKMFLYNKSDIAREDELLDIMSKAYYQMGCTHFYLDNLMMMKLENIGQDIYKKQAAFMNSLKSFSLKDVHVNVIVHPHKTDKETLTKDDIGGAGEITNIADNVLIIHKRDMQNGKYEYPAMVKIDKGRIGGTGEVLLDFNVNTKRYYTPGNNIEKDFKYSWQYEKKIENQLYTDDDFPDWGE